MTIWQNRSGGGQFFDNEFFGLTFFWATKNQNWWRERFSHPPSRVEAANIIWIGWETKKLDHFQNSQIFPPPPPFLPFFFWAERHVNFAILSGKKKMTFSKLLVIVQKQSLGRFSALLMVCGLWETKKNWFLSNLHRLKQLKGGKWWMPPEPTLYAEMGSEVIYTSTQKKTTFPK